MEHDTRSCHFAPWEPGCSAGKVMPVDADHPANATLTWTWDNPKYIKNLARIEYERTAPRDSDGNLFVSFDGLCEFLKPKGA